MSNNENNKDLNNLEDEIKEVDNTEVETEENEEVQITEENLIDDNELEESVEVNELDNIEEDTQEEVEEAIVDDNFIDEIQNESSNEILEESNQANKKNKRKKIYISLGIVGAVIVGGLTYFLTVKNNVENWNNKIYTGITINGIDVGGKTKDEAVKYLKNGLIEKVEDKKITISSEGESIAIEYDKIKPSYKVEDAVNEAFKIGKDESLFDKNSHIKNGVEKDIEIAFGYDEKAIDECIAALNDKMLIPAKDAVLNINGGELEIIKEEKGLELDREKSIELIKAELDCDIDVMKEKIELPTKASEAKITEKALSEIDGILGSSSTRYNGGDVSRTTNLRIATGNINGMILMPGEEFSYNEVVGERTTARGFREGAAFVGNKVVQSVGGGICQISTTLYQSIMKSGIKSTERYNHSMSVTYAAHSEDATVAWGYLDYKFKNIYDSPIYIQGNIGDGIVTFNIYGDTDDLGGHTYDLVGVSLGGNTSAGYLVTYKDGKEIDRERVSTDTYK